ncbi:MAG: HEAT repeat domain-containing protein [Deltaproteobacteria bacterium]|nr:HEAT repeat domain-containing protein [Deltaproteobacteria bacterium]
MIRWLLLFLSLIGLACQNKAPLQSFIDPPKNFEEVLSRSTYVLQVRVKSMKVWEGRSDWQIIQLEPLEIYRGKKTGEIQILEQKLFHQDSNRLEQNQIYTLLLQELPAFDLYQPLFQKKIRYQLTDVKRGIFSKPEDQKPFKEFFEARQKTDKTHLKKLYQDFFQSSPSEHLKEILGSEFFSATLKPELVSSDLTRIIQEIPHLKDYDLRRDWTIGLLSLPPHQIPDLSSLFCVSPEEVCLRVAEFLESQKKTISLSSYEQALQSAPSSLRVGLLEILGRHQRQEGLSLFEKYLPMENDEQQTGLILEALGKMGGDPALELVLRYANDKRAYVKVGMIRALGNLKSEKGIPALENALKTQDPSLVALAAQSLQQIDTPAARETLGKYYEKGHHGHWEPAGSHQHFLPK